MTERDEYLLDGRKDISGCLQDGFVGRTNRGWVALPFGENPGRIRLFGFLRQWQAQAASTAIVERERALRDRPIHEVYSNQRLYPSRDVDNFESKDYTVMVRGSERLDGEGPWIFVVSAESQSAAWATALSTYIRREQDIDCYVDERGSFEGLPAEDALYVWEDLRGQDGFWKAIESFAQTVARFEEERKPYLDEEGSIADKHHSGHDHLLGDYEEGLFQEVWDMVIASKHV